MTKWEYRLFTINVNQAGLSARTSDCSFIQNLESFGEDGWELAGVTQDSDAYGLNSVLYIFKRPQEDKELAQN